MGKNSADISDMTPNIVFPPTLSFLKHKSIQRNLIQITCNIQKIKEETSRNDNLQYN